ncbi:hypothetical protein N475_19890 [Pseudoalteromonas luteoviolacea DSM 6061]|uniref:Uncharacterized protein n=1 Tax=Pseudoalteromonas luteoviolacea DSM 6061 TaxID=1365250 RepID=A0A166VS33_9GAMM|nr:hypothetical protein N475_19890 [Pseudoalteromonas luteoviolacea DSM 6061]
MKISLVISKATFLIIVYFLIYIISDVIVSLVYVDGSYILLMLVNLLMLLFTFKNILKPLFFKRFNNIYSALLVFYGGGGCAFLFGYFLEENKDFSIKVCILVFYSSYLLFTLLFEAKENGEI